MQNDIVHKNYAKFIELPADSKASTKDAFSEIEMERIEAAANKIPFVDCILMLCYTGFRIQEFLDLTPFSYDKAAQTLTGGRKTEAGRDRVIPINQKIAPMVAAWAARGGETLICKPDGKPFKVKNFRENFTLRLWRKLMESAIFRPIAAGILLQRNFITPRSIRLK